MNATHNSNVFHAARRSYGFGWVLAGLLAIWLGGVAPVYGQTIRPLPQRIRAPLLDAPGDWINTSGPLRLQDLKGKFVILDFWTYCCINCMHILPELKKLEEAYPDTLVVIGVHSPKFVKERDTQNVREAVVREKIVHPVFNDPRRVLWTRYEVSVWPSLRIIDPEGYVIAATQGELTFRDLDRFLKSQLPKYRRKRLLDERPIKFDLEVEKQEERPLRFPGKVLADAESDRLFVADTYHNRIVVSTLSGELIETIGSGATGKQDGSFEEASFDHPQGMALHGDWLYIADTENHLIRKANLQTKQVVTVAGTGLQRRRQDVRGGTRTRGVALASPWALLVVGDELFIAMAGSHQIWKMPLDESRIGPYAGNGNEDIVDGPRISRQAYQSGSAEFAQPSGLGSDGQWVFVADSEGSSIRAVPVDPSKKVVTVLGTAHLPKNRLFTFGDRDGRIGTAMLQHPIGLTYADGVIYVADTYNDKVRAINLMQQSVTTIAGGGAAADPAGGAADLPLNEPSGVSVAAGKLYIADTNAHRIRVVSLANPAGGLETLEIKGLEPPQSPEEEWKPLPGARMIKLADQKVQAANGALPIEVNLTLPLGYKWNAGAGFECRVDAAGDEPLFDKEKLLEVSQLSHDTTGTIRLEVPIEKAQGADRIRVAVTYFYCQEGREALCRIGQVHFIGKVEISADGQAALSLEHMLRPAN